MQTRLKLRPVIGQLLKRLRTPFTLVAAIVLGYLVLGILYIQAGDAAAALERRTQISRAALRRPAPELEKFEAELARTEAEVGDLKARRLSSIPEEDLIQQTLAAARAAGISVTGAGTRAETMVDRDDRKVRATPFFLRATGAPEQIERFLSSMEKGSVETLELQSALVTRETNYHVLTLSAVIYGHSSDGPQATTTSAAGANGKVTPTPAADGKRAR